MAAFKSGAESILYHNGNAKATTDVGGIIITGVATATGFSGPLTGTATGLSGSPSIEVTNIVGTAASIAGIVTATTFSGDLTGTINTAAQPNITSLGTIASLVASTAKVSDLTNNRIVIAGASGELEDSANLTFDNTGLVVTGNLNVTGVTTIQGYSSLSRSMGISQVLGNICRYAGDNVQTVIA